MIAILVAINILFLLGMCWQRRLINEQRHDINLCQEELEKMEMRLKVKTTKEKWSG